MVEPIYTAVPYTELGSLPTRIVEYTASFSPATKDIGCLIAVNSASAVTVTIPLYAGEFQVGQSLVFYQAGAGTVTFAGADGVTVNSANSYLQISAQYAAVLAVKTATNTWLLIGSLASGA